MGFVLTLLYISLALLSPDRLLPTLVEYRVELLLAIVTLLVSAPRLLDRRFLRTPQVYLLAGMLAAVFISQALDTSWLGAGFNAVEQFLSLSIAFYLIVLNCDTLRRLKVLTYLLIFVAVLYIVQGSRAYLAGDVTSPLLKVITASDGSVSFRMQGQGFLYDPNDFAQFLVMVLPFIWMGWRQRAYVRNFFFVLAPSALFVWGVYLTHSRGGMLALAVIMVLSLRERTNVVSALAGGLVAFAAFVALNFSGGREISLQAGSDRMGLWGDGLQMFKQSPLFGVGFHGFAGHDFGLTAHNSFVVCLAELGIVGYLFWIGLIVVTVAALTSLISALKQKRTAELLGSNSMPAGKQLSQSGLDLNPQEAEEIERWARAFRISLGGFVAAGWFLSRAYVITLYVVLGMAVTLLWQVASEEEPIMRRPAGRLLALTVASGLAAIFLIYMSLRLRGIIALFG